MLSGILLNLKAYGCSLLLHIVVLLLLIFSFEFEPDILYPPKSKVQAVAAVSVDRQQVMQELERLQAHEQAKRDTHTALQQETKKLTEKRVKEEARLKNLQKKKKAEQAQRRQEEKRLTELQTRQKEVEKQRQKAEEERLRIEKEKQRAEEEKQRAEEERLRLEEEKQAQAEEKARIEKEKQAQVEALKKLEEEKKRKEQELKKLKEARQEQKRHQAQRDLADELAKERENRYQIEAQKYGSLIEAKIKSKFNTLGVTPGLSCKLFIKMSPNGEVMEVRIKKSSGNGLYDKRAEAAVYAASPLPIPDDLRLAKEIKGGIEIDYEY